jgi:hypothetical protein
VAALGLLLLLVAGTFDAEPRVTGAARCCRGVGVGDVIGVGGHGARSAASRRRAR